MPTIVPATSSGKTDFCLRLETRRTGTKYPANTNYPQIEPECLLFKFQTKYLCVSLFLY